MAKNTTDRRVARTRATLQRALISLILKKDYEAITISEICEVANVGRSTFYAHYSSKDDLKRSGFEDQLHRMLGPHHGEHAPSRDPSLAFSLPLLEHARERMDLYRALTSGRGGAVALEIVRRTLSETVRRELAAIPTKTSAEAPPREFVVQYIVGAYMSVLTWWLDGGAKMAPAQVDAMFKTMAREGIAQLAPQKR